MGCYPTLRVRHSLTDVMSGVDELLLSLCDPAGPKEVLSHSDPGSWLATGEELGHVRVCDFEFYTDLL